MTDFPPSFTPSIASIESIRSIKVSEVSVVLKVFIFTKDISIEHRY